MPTQPKKSDSIETGKVLRLIEENAACAVEFLNPQDEKAARGFKMIAYSGAVVQRYFGRMVFDLDGISLDSKRTPILKNHDPEQIVGFSDSVDRTDAGIVISGKMSKSTDAAKQVMSLSDEGFPWQASVGMEPVTVERLEPGAETVVNGSKLIGPAYVVRKSKLRESSFVPVGADGDTSGVVLSFFKENDQKEKLNMADENKPAPVDAEAVKKTTLEAERKRVAELNAAFPKDPAFANLAITKGLSVVEAKAEYSDKLQADIDARDAAELAAKSKKPGAAGVPAIKFSGASENESSEEKGFLELAGAYKEKHNCSEQVALSATARAHPEVHAAFVAQSREAKPRKIERVAGK